MEKERRIVVGIEGSGYARAALVWALEEALHRDALVEVVTCYSPTCWHRYRLWPSTSET